MRNHRCMNQTNGYGTDPRRIHSPSALDKARALNKIISLFQLLNKFRYILDAVLVVPVNGHDPLVPSLQGPPDSHTELCSLPAGVLLDKQGIHLQISQLLFFRAAICGAAVTDHKICPVRNVMLLRAFQLLLNPVPFVNDWDQNDIILCFSRELLTGKARNPRLLFINDLIAADFHKLPFFFPFVRPMPASPTPLAISEKIERT